jgi:hypothetical protein
MTTTTAPTIVLLSMCSQLPEALHENLNHETVHAH